MITLGNQTFQITPNRNKKPLIKLKAFQKISIPGQSDIPCFAMTIFHLDDYHWQKNF